jgi:hypothetical protein
VNHTPTGKSPLAGLRQGGKTVKKRHRVVRRAGAVVEAACGISANPYYSVQRFYRVSEARDAASVSPIGSATVVRQRFFWIFWLHCFGPLRAVIAEGRIAA